MTCHCVRRVWMPRGCYQWIDCLKTSSVFHIVFIAPDVLASSIRFIDDTLASTVHLLDAVGKSHLIRVGAVRGGCLSGSEEAWSTFASVPVGHTAGSPEHKRRIESAEVLPAKNWDRVALRIPLCRCKYFGGSCSSSGEGIQFVKVSHIPTQMKGLRLCRFCTLVCLQSFCSRHWRGSLVRPKCI